MSNKLTDKDKIETVIKICENNCECKEPVESIIGTCRWCNLKEFLYL